MENEACDAVVPAGDTPHPDWVSSPWALVEAQALPGPLLSEYIPSLLLCPPGPGVALL